MRRIALVLAGLFGLWLLWRQFGQRGRATYGNGTEANLPVWKPAPPSDSAVNQLASTAERTHNQSDALTQPPEPAPAPIPYIHVDVAAIRQANEPAEALEPDSEPATPAPDDLLRIEGIGPKISTIVVAAGITSFAELASAEATQLEAILDEAGIRTANPSTWPEQAHLAAQGKWQELKELQDRINHGRLDV